MAKFDFKNPDYADEYRRRIQNGLALKENPDIIPAMRGFYKDHCVDFIEDWGVTFDPRGTGGFLPFLLFPRQKEFVRWLVDHWQREVGGLVEKTRDMGLSWLCIAVACWICIFHKGKVIGFGSKKEADVDSSGNIGSLFEKARMFMDHLPEEFRAGYSRGTTKHMQIRFPASESMIYGGSGDELGRSERASMFIVDEAAFLERPEKALSSLAGSTNCRIDVSTPNGMGNPFYERRMSGEVDVFTFHWRDDKRRDQAWYDEKVKTIGDRATIAREFDINYAESMDNMVIEPAWVQACIDSHLKLGIANSGHRIASLDLADKGMDKNALAAGYGFLLEHMWEWSGSDEFTIFNTVQRAFGYCDQHDYHSLRYDADGIGSALRGDAKLINDARALHNKSRLEIIPFVGSGEIIYPDRKEEGRPQKNKDYFANAKAQCWWSLRTRMAKTYRAVVEGAHIEHDDLISISSKVPLLSRLTSELSQPKYEYTKIGKVVVNKTDGPNVKSPNLADAMMMFYAPIRKPLKITQAHLDSLQFQSRRNLPRITDEILQRFSRTI